MPRPTSLIHVGAWTGEEYVGDPRRLLLFEPHAEAFARLKENLHGQDVTLWRSACGSHIGNAVLHTSTPDSDNSSLLRPGVPGFSYDGRRIIFAGTQIVPMTTLDHATRDLDPFDELVIDTQGYELEVLKGGTETLQAVSRVALEVHDPLVYPGAGTLDQISSFLRPLGFGLDSVNTDGGLTEVVYLPYNSSSS